MRVDSVGSDKYSKSKVSFGYDKALNNALTKKLLSKAECSWAKTISSLQKLCVDTEDILVLSEKEGKPLPETEPLAALLLNIKPELANWVDTYLPKLDFGFKEIFHYYNSGIKALEKNGQIEGNWRLGLLDTLNYDRGLGIIENKDGKPQLVKLMGQLGEEDSFQSPSSIISEHVFNSKSPKGFSSIGGMDDLKKNLYEKIIVPIKHPERAKMDLLEYGKDYPRATMLVGPPGCGKTYIAEALAREADVPLFKFKMGKVGSSYINQTGNNYEKVFQAVEDKSKELGKPCILFMDELEGLAINREMLNSDDSLKSMGIMLDLVSTARERGIIVLGATNKPNIVDEAIKSRFDNQAYVGLPDLSTRIEVLKKNLEDKTKGRALFNSGGDLKEIAQKLENFSNRTISDISASAAQKALADGRRDITKTDYINSIKDFAIQKITDDKAYKPLVANSTFGFSKKAD